MRIRIAAAAVAFGSLLVGAACGDAPAAFTGVEAAPASAESPAVRPTGHMPERGMVASVTGSGHYTRPNGTWRTFSFQVRERTDGDVRGTFQLTLHRKPAIKQRGRLTCVSVMGNEAWIGGVFEKADNPDLVGTGFGFYVRDNGEGRAAPADLVHRFVRGQVPAEWCAETRDVSGSPFLFPVEAGNIRVRSR